MPYEDELLFYILLVIIAGLLSLFLCLFAQFKLKDAPGAKYFILMTLFSSIFTFSYAFELSSSSLEQIMFWLNIEYLVMPFIPVFILLMSLEFVGQRLKQRMYYLLFVVPIITIFMHETNELHYLYYTSIGLNEDAPFPILMVERGPWFYVHSIYLFLCLMTSMIILLKHLKNTKIFHFRMQIYLLVAGIATPIIANYFYLNGISPYGIDLGPVSMSISFIFHGAALLSYQMFNVIPIVRDTVFENMTDGVIVLNQFGAIVDFNKAMLDIMPTLAHHTIGKSIIHVVDRNESLANILLFERECDYEFYKDGQSEYYQIRFSKITNKNRHTIGKTITFVNVTERVHLQNRLTRLASIDGLTDVYNRTSFIQEAEKVINEGGTCSIIMFDIDHFKRVNDTFGHDAGDKVLASVASIVKHNLRVIDIIGRYGGEEFIICMPDSSLDEADKLAQTIRQKISECVFNYTDKEIRVTSSFGISSSMIGLKDTSKKLQILMKEADQALYHAKRKGRNVVAFYEDLCKSI